jgi:predicted molibdopterin-dependent oxidoreductase YjgC
VRGQNNVQGACDMGVLPNLFPGYQEVTDPACAPNLPPPGASTRR